MKLLNKIKKLFKCINCTYNCVENLTPYVVCCHGNVRQCKEHYPKINKMCCPKDYPLSVYLRNLAKEWNKL